MAAVDRTQEAANPMKRPMGDGLLVVALLVGAGLIALSLGRGGKAEAPPMFAAGLSLEEAANQAMADDRLVFVFATAEWCGPCQSFKRGALADARVEAWVARHAAPVYLDVDERPAEAARLGVRSIPATFLIDGQDVLGTAVGAMSAEALLEWLNSQRDAARGGASTAAAAES